MLIECAGLDASKLDLNDLGEIELNGRQIKNVQYPPSLGVSNVGQKWSFLTPRPARLKIPEEGCISSKLDK